MNLILITLLDWIQKMFSINKKNIISNYYGKQKAMAVYKICVVRK